jgi:hypothetical protein
MLPAASHRQTFTIPRGRRLLAAGLLAGLVATGLTFAGDRVEPAATPGKANTALSQRIDHLLVERLQAEKVPASPLASDAEFLRRVSLDLTGVIPTADQAAAFLDSKDPQKRAKLIDELLASPRYGRHMADIWEALLVKRDPDNRRIQLDPLYSWLEKQFNDNVSWDRVTTDLLTSTGTQDKNGAVTFFLANGTPDKVTDTVSRVFLGVQLQCAQCHNHPFTKWKQTEYWGMAAFFLKVRPDGNPRQAQQNGTPLGIGESGRGRPARLPTSAKLVPAQFFQGEQPKIGESEPARPVLAKWLTAQGNPFFARALVNRLWYQFFGRGFVAPVDDIHDGNPASHPELFQELAKQFASGGFDVKEMIRTICNSEAYQRSSKPVAGNDDADVRLFSHAAIRPLMPEELFDSLERVTGPAERARPAGRPGMGQRGAPVGSRAGFVAFFQGDEHADPTEYQAGIPQVLRLMNSNQFNVNAAAGKIAGKSEPAQAVEKLYLAALSRRPTAEESNRLTSYIQTNGDKAHGDILWALLNTSEFTLNH